MLRSLLAIPLFGAETFVLGSAVCLSARWRPDLHEAVVRLWARGVLQATGAELSASGGEGLDPAQRYVFVANHQSNLDIPCLTTAIPNTIRYVAKRELFRIPVFGPALRAIGTVDIDRRNHQQAVRSLQEAERGVARRCSLLFFAEGTRSADGELRPFKKGAVVMAQALGIPIVPVAIAGSGRVLRKGSLLLRPGPVHVAIGAPIPTVGTSDGHRGELLARTWSEVDTLFARARAAVG